MNVQPKISYIGVDEANLGVGEGSQIVLAAVTHDPKLAEDKGYHALSKSKDYIVSGERFPRLDEMRRGGLADYHWTRSRSGRFSKQVIAHASIAHVIASNGFRPESTVLLVDGFYQPAQRSQFLIGEYLRARGFDIPMQNIEIVDQGDRSIPIINYADLLAFQVGLMMHERYRKFFPRRKEFDAKTHEIPYEEKRVMVPLGEEGRSLVERVIQEWNGKPKERDSA